MSKFCYACKKYNTHDGFVNDMGDQKPGCFIPFNIGEHIFAIVNKKIVEDEIDRIEINSSCTKISTVKHSWLCNIENVFLDRNMAEEELLRRSEICK